MATRGFDFDDAVESGSGVSSDEKTTNILPAGESSLVLEARLKVFLNDGRVDTNFPKQCTKKDMVIPRVTGPLAFGTGTAKNAMEMVYGISTIPATATIPESVEFDFDQMRETVAWERVLSLSGTQTWAQLVHDNVSDPNANTKCTFLNAEREIFDWDEPGFPSVYELPGSKFDETTDISADATAIVVKNNFKNLVKALIGGTWRVISPIYTWHSISSIAQSGEDWKATAAPGENEIKTGHVNLTKP